MPDWMSVGPEVDLVPAIPNKLLNVPAKQRDKSDFQNINLTFLRFLFLLYILKKVCYLFLLFL